jgi:hypothetical protein
LDRDRVKLREWVARKHAQGWSLNEIESLAREGIMPELYQQSQIS